MPHQLAGNVTNVATVYGAILLGAFFGCGLTGIVIVQCMLYHKFYPGDFVWTKVLVSVILMFDLIHTICIITAVWQSVITKFSESEMMDHIPSALGLSVAVTAAITFMVHCFFANRIRMLTKKWYIAGPLAFFAFLRLCSACISTGEIIHLKRYSLFIKPYPSWVFTLGLALSASVELTVTIIMILYLRSRKTNFANMNHIINTLILYTVETGGITCLVTIASLICWIVMRHNLIFLGMHFVIAKLYANSLLATLNTRKRLRVDCVYSSERDQSNVHIPVPLREDLSNRMLRPTMIQKGMQLNVNVETTIISQIDEDNDPRDMDIEAVRGTTPTLRVAVFDTDRESLEEKHEKYHTIA